jgi:hypothetical protein
MYRFIFWNVGIFFAALIILFSQSCRKQDIALQLSSQEVERIFFEGSNNAGIFVSRLADTLKAKNRSTPFIVDLALGEGMAIWDKALIEINELDTLCFLPLVQRNKKYVNSFLLFKVNNKSVNTSLIQGGNYNNYNIDANWVVIKFMQMNNLVFGNTVFEVTNTNVLSVAEVQKRTGKSNIQVRLATEEEMEQMQGDALVPTDMSGIISNRPMATIVKQKCFGVVYIQNGVIVSYQGDLSCATTIVLDPQPGTPVTPTAPSPILPGMPPPTSGCKCLPSNPGLPPVKPVIKIPEPINIDSTILDSTAKDSIPAIYSIACDKQLDSLYNWGMKNGFREQSFILVKKNDSIYAKNFKPGFPSGDKTDVNYTLSSDEVLVAYAHIHAEDTVNYWRTSFSPEDLIEFNKKATVVGYTALLEVGNARYAFVLEDTQKKNIFNISKMGRHGKLYKSIFEELSIQHSNLQVLTEQSWIKYFGSSAVCGIGFYKAESSNKNKFLKLNP